MEGLGKHRVAKQRRQCETAQKEAQYIPPAPCCSPGGELKSGVVPEMEGHEHRCFLNSSILSYLLYINRFETNDRL